jgi:hypothetical protein
MTATTAACFVAAPPINPRVFRWDEDLGDPEEWRRLRRRWDQLHNVRIPLDVAGFVLITRAALDA